MAPLNGPPDESSDGAWEDPNSGAELIEFALVLPTCSS